MKITHVFVAALLSAAAFADGEPIPVRNPFWPIGYEGERAVITAEPRVTVAPVAAPAVSEETKTAADVASVAVAVAATEAEETSRFWVEARGVLSVSSPMTVTGADGVRRSSVMINGKAYADGDYVSITHRDRRFTWKVVGLNESDVLRLVRVRVRKVDSLDEGSEKGNK